MNFVIMGMIVMVGIYLSAKVFSTRTVKRLATFGAIIVFMYFAKDSGDILISKILFGLAVLMGIYIVIMGVINKIYSILTGGGRLSLFDLILIAGGIFGAKKVMDWKNNTED